MAKQAELTEEQRKMYIITDEEVEGRAVIQPRRAPVKCNLVNIEYVEGISKYDQKPFCNINFTFKEHGVDAYIEIKCTQPTLYDALHTVEESKRFNFKFDLSQLKHIAMAYVKEGSSFVVDWSQDDYKILYKRLLSLLAPNYQQIPTLLKVIYSEGGYIQTPKFPDFISTSLKTRNITFDLKDITEQNDPRIVIKPKKERGGASSAPTKSTPSAGGLWDTALPATGGGGSLGW
jgi:hypothetical protein